MRKWIVAVMLAAIVCMLTISATGAEEGLEIPNVTAKPGETVYLTFKLAEPVTGTSVAVTYACDEDVLEPIKSSSTWAKKGVLQDFDTFKMTGVWADAQAVELKGNICTVAFRVVSKKMHFDTKVICTVKVKNGSADVASFTEEVWVSTECSHSFGAWTETGSVGHQRSCIICLRVQQQAHNWDGGTTEKDPNGVDMEVTVFRCKECDAKMEVPNLPNVVPTSPAETEPMGPPSTKPMLPTQPGEQMPTEPPDGTKPSGGEGAIVPTQGSEQNTVNKEEHDHNHDMGENQRPVADSETMGKNALVFAGTFGALIGVALLIVKKKR